jgi:methionine sulfoxide reductase heme-binding subunit
MSVLATSASVWYLMRASGAVTMLMLSAVLALGVATTNRGRLGRLPRFATLSLHRNVALVAVAFLSLHIATAVVDPYAQVGLISVVVPFVGAGKPLWVGLGATSLDVVAAIGITSLVRSRLPRKAWIAVHRLAYLSWPLALVHSLGIGSDTGTVWLRGLSAVCVALVAGAVVWRLRAGGKTGKHLEPQHLPHPEPASTRYSHHVERVAA